MKGKAQSRKSTISLVKTLEPMQTVSVDTIEPIK